MPTKASLLIVHGFPAGGKCNSDYYWDEDTGHWAQNTYKRVAVKAPSTCYDTKYPFDPIETPGDVTALVFPSGKALDGKKKGDKLKVKGFTSHPKLDTSYVWTGDSWIHPRADWGNFRFIPGPIPTGHIFDALTDTAVSGYIYDTDINRVVYTIPGSPAPDSWNVIPTTNPDEPTSKRNLYIAIALIAIMVLAVLVGSVVIYRTL